MGKGWGDTNVRGLGGAKKEVDPRFFGGKRKNPLKPCKTKGGRSTQKREGGESSRGRGKGEQDN